jgi:peptide chain release factor subunit 1
MNQEILNYLGSLTGSSMLTILIPQNKDVYKMRQKLEDELEYSSRIKNEVKRNDFSKTITAANSILSLFQKTHVNGFCIPCGIVDGKEINIGFEPITPLNRSLYICNRRFHVEAIQ